MKFYHYVIIMIGIMLTLNFAGFELPSGGLARTLLLSNSTATDSLTSTSGGIQDIVNSSWWRSVITALGLAAAVGVVVGFYFNTPPPSYLLASILVIFSGLMLSDMVWIWQKAASYGVIWITASITVIVGGMILGYMVTVMEWWKGSSE